MDRERVGSSKAGLSRLFGQEAGPRFRVAVDVVSIDAVAGLSEALEYRRLEALRCSPSVHAARSASIWRSQGTIWFQLAGIGDTIHFRRLPDRGLDARPAMHYNVVHVSQE